MSNKKSKVVNISVRVVTMTVQDSSV